MFYWKTSPDSRVVVLPLGVAALLSLPCLIIVRLGILGTIRVGIFN